MHTTLGLTGMDPATENALKAAFDDANARVGGAWRLVPESEADHVIVDMDSMYGPMSWLRLHGAGKSVVGLTTAPRVQTDHRLPRPFSAHDIAALLQEMVPGSLTAATPVTATPVTPVREAPAPIAAPTAPSAPAPTAAAPAASAPTPASRTEPVATPLPAAPAPAAATPRPAIAHASRRLIDRLASGELRGRVRVEAGGQFVLIDADQRHYHGPQTLKPLSPLLDGDLADAALVAPDAADWQRQAAALGDAQPLARLVWFGALLAGHGQLAAGFDPEARYQLGKWPQTEREFPKHFRIATAMMKGPATLAEVAQASGVPLDEVTDFVNANLATGFAEPFREPSPEPEPSKPSGLFGRLRGR